MILSRPLDIPLRSKGGKNETLKEGGLQISTFFKNPLELLRGKCNFFETFRGFGNMLDPSETH